MKDSDLCSLLTRQEEILLGPRIEALLLVAPEPIAEWVSSALTALHDEAEENGRAAVSFYRIPTETAAVSGLLLRASHHPPIEAFLRLAELASVAAGAVLQAPPGLELSTAGNSDLADRWVLHLVADAARPRNLWRLTDHIHGGHGVAFYAGHDPRAVRSSTRESPTLARLVAEHGPAALEGLWSCEIPDLGIASREALATIVGSSAAPPPAGGRDKARKRDNAQKKAQALILVSQNPERTDKAIAEEVDLDPSTLSRDKMYQAARERAEAACRESRSPRRGHVAREDDAPRSRRSLEAYSDEP